MNSADCCPRVNDIGFFEAEDGLDWRETEEGVSLKALEITTTIINSDVYGVLHTGSSSHNHPGV